MKYIFYFCNRKPEKVTDDRVALRIARRHPRRICKILVGKPPFRGEIDLASLYRKGNRNNQP
ncbi:MAG: hypothetical protein ACP5U2_17965, partial [Bryobacteraceae bacterium]